MVVKQVIIGLFVAWLFTVLTGGVHKIEEGYVGVYYIGGVLSQKITSPGINFLTPLLTSYYPVQITVQTDAITNIPCGTSGGVMISFDRVEVVNRLKKEFVYETIKNYTVDYDKTWIYDKIHHEINQFCTKHTLREVYIDKFDTLDEELALALQKDIAIWAPGIEIIAIRVTKPNIPERVRRNFEEMESEKTKLLIVTENQKVRLQEADTQKQQALIKATTVFEVTNINIEREIQEQINKKKLATLDNENYVNKARSEADAQYYIASKELETVKQRLTEEFLQFESIQSLTSNLKLYLGSQIPAYINFNGAESEKMNIGMFNK